MTNNINIKLPSGDIKSYPNKITPSDIAAEISISLKKNAIISKVNNKLWDLDRSIDFDCDLEIITKGNKDLLEVLRHDAAHVMAEAVLELYPDTQITIGPAIDNGFYYDFYKKENFTPKDLELIEKRMHEIVDRNEEIIREVWTREEAINFFKKNNEKFKLELINDIPDDQEISFYKQGNFIDLCRGPHFKSTKMLGHAFKLTKLAGAYWRGDSNKETLQRIYGTAFFTQNDLDNYLLMLEEAEKRDHRKLGKKLQLFHMQEEAAGSVFWHPKGWSIYLEIEAYMRRKLATHNYNEVKTPQVIDRTLWEKSGHWDKFKENMFMVEGEGNKVLALKPMNCPGHVQIFKQGIKSYKDLPIRMSEFGSCHRNEPSGALHGIMRVRQFTQDDAHIFCTDEQITDESLIFCDLLRDIYKDFGFDQLKVKFSDRPEVRAGSDKVWDKAEKALIEAVNKAQLDYDLNPGEGAFYGPKLEFVLIDAIGREWQCGTLQMDFVLPERLGATYIDKKGEKKNPVMLHRAILGSMERWLGILIEQYSGRFPLWLTPVQVFVCTITEKANEYALGLKNELKNNNIRCDIDLRNEKIGYKIREHSENGCPIILIVGEKEKDGKSVAIRKLGSKNQDFKLFKDFIEEIKLESKPPDLVWKFFQKVYFITTIIGEISINDSKSSFSAKDGPRINNSISAQQVRCIDSQGKQLGILSIHEALQAASSIGLDLVEIQPNVSPPVCKILDYGKFKYESQKRKNEARKKQKTIDVKEIKLRPNIDSHDFDVKIKSVKKFLENGDKVKITLRFRGREMVHQELGSNVLDRVKDETDAFSKIEALPKLEGRQMVMVLAPK